jgi:hypothetical protein
MRSFVICNVKKCYYNDERKECGVGETCNMHGQIKNEYMIVVGKFGCNTSWRKLKANG